MTTQPKPPAARGDQQAHGLDLNPGGQKGHDPRRNPGGQMGQGRPDEAQGRNATGSPPVPADGSVKQR